MLDSIKNKFDVSSKILIGKIGKNVNSIDSSSNLFQQVLTLSETGTLLTLQALQSSAAI